ncbi:hypothetical protein SKAU_G00304580 [Synaphobranchus kaupii]|uniref:Uncharacterized protein n=1 Tax=Synaphobranchus kaupii TaxID=118154 RepID=A0A9Q1EWD4_SYNKA|nr:hypothetical protein SKAU_G00304580 [Synaphobranchus kaupii]
MALLQGKGVLNAFIISADGGEESNFTSEISFHAGGRTAPVPGHTCKGRRFPTAFPGKRSVSPGLKLGGVSELTALWCSGSTFVKGWGCTAPLRFQE